MLGSATTRNKNYERFCGADAGLEGLEQGQPKKERSTGTQPPGIHPARLAPKDKGTPIAPLVYPWRVIVQAGSLEKVT